MIKLNGSGSQQAAISKCIRRLGTLSLPVKHVPLTKEIVTVIRWLILAINSVLGDDMDGDYTHIAAFVSHAITQDQLILRGLTVVPTASSSNDIEEDEEGGNLRMLDHHVSMETDDGVYAGMFLFLLNYLNRVMDNWNASQSGNDSSSNLVVHNKEDADTAPTAVSTAGATVIPSVVGCLTCLILMIERSCAFSSKQPSMTPADPASVPPGRYFDSRP